MHACLLFSSVGAQAKVRRQVAAKEVRLERESSSFSTCLTFRGKIFLKKCSLA